MKTPGRMHHVRREERADCRETYDRLHIDHRARTSTCVRCAAYDISYLCSFCGDRISRLFAHREYHARRHLARHARAHVVALVTRRGRSAPSRQKYAIAIANQSIHTVGRSARDASGIRIARLRWARGFAARDNRTARGNPHDRITTITNSTTVISCRVRVGAPRRQMIGHQRIPLSSSAVGAARACVLVALPYT